MNVNDPGDAFDAGRLRPRVASVTAMTGPARAGEHVHTFTMFGVSCTIAASVEPQTLGLIEDRLGVLHRSWTRFDPGSDLCRAVAHAGDRVEIPWHLADLLALADQYRQLSGGAFDITVNVAELGYDEHIDQVRDQPVRATRRPSARSQFAGAGFNVVGNTVQVDPGRTIDLGGIGKGHAADLALAWLGEYSDSRIWVDIGGDIATNAPATVTAVDRDDQAWCAWTISSGGVATSSPWARTWTGSDGTTLHHIVDPRTAMPVATPYDVVSCHATTAAAAEAATKTVLVTGDPEAATLLGAVAATRNNRAMADISESAGRWAKPVICLPVTHMAPTTRHEHAEPDRPGDLT